MTNDKSLRVLVVDDTVVYRKIISDALAELPGVEVVGAAYNGKAAMLKIASLKPDLLTLDIEMPEMNGLEVLERIRKESLNVGAIMLSTLTMKGGEMTIKALRLGAFDFLPKPQSGSMEENKQAVRQTLGPILKAFIQHMKMKGILRKKIGVSDAIQKPSAFSLLSGSKARAGRKGQKPDVVAIGISTGGPNALTQMMPGLPADLNIPVLIVQHMPPVFTKSLAASLNSICAIDVREAVNGETIRPNTALIAPGGKQMKVVTAADRKTRIIKITDDPPENSCKPSADYLFRSVAHNYGGRATGVIMTGMGADGTLGLKLMKRKGATIIGQDEASCVVYGMPKEAADAGIVDVVVPLRRISQEICRSL
ncbi:MAG: chemotaxis response regulator protein-glutamate methylesterase [Thermodesulfobacteriota bacterium]|nr:chemotaxis response regulator protein-glutamate methylesterase [Thermodesulfobacteriota bacterium]